MEISGVDHGPEGTIFGRLRAKLKQAASGRSNLPALAVVVGFKARLIVLEDVYVGTIHPPEGSDVLA